MKKVFFGILMVGVVLGFFLRDLFHEKPAAAKVVTIKNRNLEFQVATYAKTVRDVLIEQGWQDGVIPDPIGDPENQILDSRPPIGVEGKLRGNDDVMQGQIIDLRKKIAATIIDGGNSREVQTFAETVGDLLNSEKIGLAATDKVTPALETYLAEGTTITIDRIVDLEVTETHEIPFAVQIEYDHTEYYGKEQTAHAGRVGKKEQRFLITYKNGIEVKRKLLQEKVLEKPVAEIRNFGTKIEVEVSEEGRASWYVYKGCSCAAHPTFPFGRFVRVTSLESGKSAIVKINDRGPDTRIHPDRVIDLDSTVFKEFAPLGAGTIHVKVELLKSN